MWDNVTEVGNGSSFPFRVRGSAFRAYRESLEEGKVTGANTTVGVHPHPLLEGLLYCIENVTLLLRNTERRNSFDYPKGIYSKTQATVGGSLFRP